LDFERERKAVIESNTALLRLVSELARPQKTLNFLEKPVILSLQRRFQVFVIRAGRIKRPT
jgi:hypothetical protein